MLNPLNSSMIAVAITRVQGTFNASFADVSWLIASFYLASCIGQPVMGKLCDAWGRKRMFMVGLVLVAVASMLAPFAPSFGWLIAIRLIQAVGSSTIFPAGMGIIRRTITQNQARALAILSMFANTSAALGPSVGGFLINAWDWQAIFLVNFPFVIASFVLAIRILPNDRPQEGDNARVDWLGAGLFCVSIILLLLFLLSLDRKIGWWQGLLAIASLVLFYQLESHVQNPFLDVQGLRRNFNVSTIYLQFMLVNFVFYTIYFAVPNYLQQVRHFSVKDTGLIMLAMAWASVISAPITGRWIDRSGTKSPLLAGAASVLGGSFLLLLINDFSNAWVIFLVLCVIGMSSGINNLGMQTSLYSFVRKEETGAAFGLFMTSRYMGTILSSSFLGLAFGHVINTQRFHLVAVVCTVIGILLLLLTIRMPRLQPPKNNHLGGA